MRPVLFSILGLDIQSYGLSKAAAALLGAFLLGRAFARRGLPRESAHQLVLWATVWGFVGAKIYFLLEHLDQISWHHLGGMGFTWYGGLLGGLAAALVIIRRHGLPLATVAGEAAAPLSAAYAVGRLGCFLSGDGTYGRPTTLPWGMRFPNGVVATDVPVHPTPLYEAIVAALLAIALWRYAQRADPGRVFGAYLVLSGLARFLVEFLRVNDQSLFGLTQPQLWGLASIAAGLVVWWRRRSAPGPAPSEDQGADVEAARAA